MENRGIEAGLLLWNPMQSARGDKAPWRDYRIAGARTKWDFLQEICTTSLASHPL
jgi:hypothetical protein